MLWTRRSDPLHDKARAAGLDLTASRLRAVVTATGGVRPLLLNDPDEALPLFIALDGRTPAVGRAGHALCRKTPHLVCANFLPAVGRARVWKAGRHSLTPETALELVLATARGVVSAESEAVVLTLPAYLTPAQVTKVAAAAGQARLPLKGTAVGLLALVADRAADFLAGLPTGTNPPPPDWVVPLRRPTATGPGTVVVLDADEHALSATVVSVERDRVRLAASGDWPRFASRLWKDKLLDAVADRCVRLCRRDPRDSADAEQALYEQLDDALDHARAGHAVKLTIRTDRWYQDVIQQPDEFERPCSALARGAAEALATLLDELGLATPPRAVWLTHEAGRLPGLVRTVHTYTPEGTAVDVLPARAVAQAAACLVPRWLRAELPRAHLDTTIPLASGSGSSSARREPSRPATGPAPRPPS